MYDFPRQMTAQLHFLDGSEFSSEQHNELVRQSRRLAMLVCTGLDPSMRRKVGAAAQEPGIEEFCPNDRKRFADDESGAAWANKGRALLGLLTPSKQLLAYGWTGIEETDVMPDAPFTTAYRVTELGGHYARAIRRNVEPTFRMGYLLGQLVIATAQHYGAARHEISLETWASNHKALRLYEDLGFELRAEKAEPDGRLTLQPLGSSINGHTVYQQRNSKTNNLERRVFDTRRYYSLRAA